MIDNVRIWVKSGDGGNGVVHFIRAKYVPRGGPDGGNGGKGGDIYLVGDGDLNTLRYFTYHQSFSASDGQRGSGNLKKGAAGGDLHIKVPLGTTVYRITEEETPQLLANITEKGQEVLVAEGGRGGCGNAHYKTSTHQAPHIAQLGVPGEEYTLLLQLKLIADVGIIGQPNAGKSTLLAAASAAKPKIASYPFTTTEPILGVVNIDDNTFTLAEIPGLIEGAHEGRGLGYEFLRHVERTRVLIHLLDGTRENPVADFNEVRRELLLYDSSLMGKPFVVAVNKTDLPGVKKRQTILKEELQTLEVPLFFISADRKQGITELMTGVALLLEKLKTEQTEETVSRVIYRPKSRYDRITVLRDEDGFVVSGPGVARLKIQADSPQEIALLKEQLNTLGATKILHKAGIQGGDRVRVGNINMEW